MPSSLPSALEARRLHPPGVCFWGQSWMGRHSSSTGRRSPHAFSCPLTRTAGGEGAKLWVLNSKSVLSRVGWKLPFPRFSSHQTPHPLESSGHLSAFTAFTFGS